MGFGCPVDRHRHIVLVFTAYLSPEIFPPTVLRNLGRGLTRTLGLSDFGKSV